MSSLSPEQRAKAASPASREKCARTILARNAVTWLKRQVEKSKLDIEVRARANRIFDDLSRRVDIRTLSEDQAQQEAFRIAARIHWTRATHRMLSMSQSDKQYMTVSKVTAQWTSMDTKLNSLNKKNGKETSGRRKMPTAATRQPDPSPHEGSEGDGETA